MRKDTSAPEPLTQPRTVDSTGTIQIGQTFRKIVDAARRLSGGVAAKEVTRDEKELPSKFQSSKIIPQADVTERYLQFYENRDWRGYFSSKLHGHGLEIGPLHRPMVKHDNMTVDYIDRYSVAELRSAYPELADLPLVEPDILGNAEDLAGIKDQSYDFVISAHVIEHMRNPLAALEHWRRVVKPGGLIYLIVPDKRNTFDKQRVRTLLEHMILDYQEPSAERDKEHFLDYVVQIHELGANEALKEARRLIETDYSIHFHVFIPTDIVNLVRWFDENVSPIRIVEGPAMSPGSDEFHLLLAAE